MALTYDRRVHPDLLAALTPPTGWAHSLVEYGRAGQYALDLQLRGYAGKPGHWATLYVGLTKVLDLHYRHGRFRLDAHGTYRQKALGWRTEWEKSQSAERLAEEWPAVEDYLERAIPKVGPRHLHEGAVQSAISGFASRHMAVIDREAVIGFTSRPEKTRVNKELTRMVLGACEWPKGPGWWKSFPTTLGGECDALAVTTDRELLAVEVKPAKATGTICWAPLQVRHYANLFNQWANETDNAGEIIQGMVNQRASLGLVSRPVPTLTKPVRVHPVVAIGHGYSPTALERLKSVHERLVDAGVDDPPLQVYSVTLAGRLDRIEL